MINRSNYTYLEQYNMKKISRDSCMTVNIKSSSNIVHKDAFVVYG